jgi:TatA/E family protein of Tat protein translocase
MFGVGPQEMVIVGLIFLVIFGPGSLPKMAKDMGRFVAEARRAIDDFKDEITAAGEDDEDDVDDDLDDADVDQDDPDDKKERDL